MFSIFDIIILTIISISSLSGMYGGLIRLSVNLLGFVLSIIIACYLYPFIQELFSKHFSNEVVVTIISGTSSYVLSLIIISLLTSKLIILVKPISCGIVDRFLGLFAGFIRGVIISVILFTIITIFTSRSYLKADNIYDLFKETKTEQYPEWLNKSSTTQYLDIIGKNLPNMFSEETLKSIKLPKRQDTKNALDLIKNTDLHEQITSNSELNQDDLEEELDEIIK